MSGPEKPNTGQKFGAWTVLGEGAKKPYYKCECDCGVIKEIRAYDLMKGKTTMCKGCATHVAQTGHSQAISGQVSTEYNTWQHILQRCYNPKNKDYPRYGGRGIEVHPLWKDSFEAFYMMMGPKPDPSYTIERIDYDKGYEPGNCKWASKAEQTRNKSDNVVLTVNGVSKVASEWALEKGASNLSAIYKRKVRGWSDEEAVFGRKSSKKD